MDTTRPSLLLRIRDRDDVAAWSTFDAIYRPLLVRYAHNCGLHPADAEDVAQQCLAVISDKIAEFTYEPQRGRFKSWLRTLVGNRVRNWARGRHEQQGGTGTFAIPSEREPAPDEAFDRIWQEEHLWHCLRELRAEVENTTYQAFAQYVLEQRPLAEVCAALHLTANNVYTIKWRLTQRVAAKMRELVDGFE